MRFLKYLGLLFPSLALCSCVPNNVTTPIFHQDKPLLNAIDNSLFDSYINSDNEVVILGDDIYDSNSIFSLAFFDFTLSLYNLHQPSTFTYSGFYADYDNYTHHSIDFIVRYSGTAGGYNTILLRGGTTQSVNNNLTWSYIDNGSYALKSDYYTYGITKLYLPLDSSVALGSFFFDYLRINDTSNVYDIVNGGFHSNYVYRFDWQLFIDNYNDMISSYPSISYNDISSYYSKGRLLSYDDSGALAFDLLTSMQFPYSCSIGDLDTRNDSNFNYVFSNQYDTSYSIPRQFLMFFNNSNTTYSLYPRGFTGEFIFSGYQNSSYGTSYFTTGNSIYINTLMQHYSRGSSMGLNEFLLNKRYSYFVCDNAYLFNSLYFNIITTSDIPSQGNLYIGRVVSPYYGDYFIKGIHRYGYYGTSNFVTDLYFAYLNSFTCLGLYNSDLATISTVRPIYYYNNGDTDSYVLTFSSGFTQTFIYHKVDNNMYFNGNYNQDFSYIDIYLYSDFSKSYLDIPSNTSITYPFSNYSIVTTSLGSCIRLDTSQSYTLKNLIMSFTLHQGNYSRLFVFDFTFNGYAQFQDIPLVENDDFYTYFFAIFDSPVYMVSQFLVVPFDFNILALLVALMSLAFVMFIIRLVV